MGKNKLTYNEDTVLLYISMEAVDNKLYLSRPMRSLLATNCRLKNISGYLSKLIKKGYIKRIEPNYNSIEILKQ